MFDLFFGNPTLKFLKVKEKTCVISWWRRRSCAPHVEPRTIDKVVLFLIREVGRRRLLPDLFLFSSEALKLFHFLIFVLQQQQRPLGLCCLLLLGDRPLNYILIGKHKFSCSVVVA